MASATADTLTDMPPHAPEYAARNRSVIAILLVATFVVFLNETIMAVALPRLMLALDASASAAQWLTTAFLLTMAVVIPVTGFLLQRANTRPLFMLAMGLFSLGTLAASLSPTLGFLIGARVVQALGTAIMMPLLMTTVMTLVAPDRRGPVMGNISLVISVAPAIGPAISGIVLNYLSWPWLFWLVLPISLGVLVLGARRIENVTTPRYARLDLLSVPISGVAFGGLVYGLSSFGTPGVSLSANTQGQWSVAIGAVAMVVFVLRQRMLQRSDRALLDLRTFASRNFSLAVLMMAISMLALFGTIILLPIYLQNVLGLSTLHTGLLLLPGGIVMGLLGPQVGRIYERVGPTALILPGSILVSAVLWAMTLLSPQTPWINILIGHIVMSTGLACVFTPLFTVSLSSVPPQLYSHGSATLGSIQQVAGAAGVALFIAVMSSRSGVLQSGGTDAVTALSSGITTAFTIGASLSLVSIVVAAFIRRPPSFGQMPAGH